MPMSISISDSVQVDKGKEAVGFDNNVPQAKSRQPTFERRESAAHNSSAPTRTMLERRGSMQSAARSARSFWARFSDRKGRYPVHPSLPHIQREEGAPAPRGEPVNCSFDKIFSLIVPQRTLPDFDGLSSYIIVNKVHEKLWGMETERLLDIVKNPEKPLQFSSDTLFSGNDEDGYRELSKACQKIQTAVSICLLDNETINSEHCGQLSNKDKLSKLIKQATLKQNTTKDEASGNCSNSRDDMILDATFCLVNYISAVLARLISQTSPGEYWQCNVLSVLIKRVAKIKVLLSDLHAHSAVAVRAGVAALDKVRNAGPVPQSVLDEEEECEELLRLLDANEKEGLASLEEKRVASYCIEQNRFQTGINAFLNFMLVSMRFTNRSGLPATTFELCAVVYETGFEGFKSLLFQDRDLEYSATSDLDTLNTAHSAFSILSQTVFHLKEAQESNGPPTRKPFKLETYVEWAYLGSENSDGVEHSDVDLAYRKKGPIRLQTMEEVVTVMVPLFATCPIFVSNLTKFRNMMALSGRIRDDVQPFEEGNFNAFFRMYTSDFDKTMGQRDVLRLSEALELGFFSRSSLTSGSVVPGFTNPDRSIDDQNTKAAQDLHKLDGLIKEMDQWVIDEKSVVIQCGWYVWPTILVAALLVGGGLIIGFSVGERIHGVDPSNLASYLWVVAAFIIVIAKSVHVKDWTWNDFLHRRVRCCSVSELHALTGINEQLIMAKLLHDEGDYGSGGSVLKIRGPYNSVFRKRASGEGFSIDVPVTTRTLLLSGLTLLKAVTPRGHALVCLDSRRGADLRVVEHQGGQNNEHLVCADINPPRTKRSESRANKRWSGYGDTEIRLPLTRCKTLKWKRVQGIYNVMDATFT